MAVTDLTGTKWVLTGFEYDVYQSDGWGYEIDFISNNETFDKFGFNYTYIPAFNPQEPAVYAGNFYYGETDIVTIDGLTDGLVEVPNEYQIISITGGTDATNADLISWLQANATQVVEPTITDLTGTRWQLNAIPSENTKVYSVGGVVQGIEGFTKIMHLASGATASVNFSNGGSGSSASVFYGTGSTYQGWYHRSKGTSGSATFTPLQTPPIIKFISGYDITNTNLISWLQANATQIIEPANHFSFGNLPIADMYFGTKRVIKAYFGNSLVWEKETPVPENALLAQDGKLFANGGGYLITTEVTLITFSISDVSYQAEEGMTWGEWVESEYNTDGFTAGDDYIKTPGTLIVSGGVKPSDVIIANKNYGTSGGGSND